ncbi:SDR family oxidoreductase [Microbacterium sp. RD1]|uniref:SDR family oxidoreductase n=1 Tax=Microbacterium sp. RD1 TaxID=3457313 RepID=UPI003FA5C0E7
MKVFIAGGRGQVGAKLADALTARGANVVVGSRASGVDHMTGEGLDVALTGVDVVVNVLNIGRFDDVAADFFETTARNLVEAGERASVGHHVLLSIVGVSEDDGPDNGYWRGKIAQESVVRSAAAPATIVRTTQFHSWVPTLADQHTVDGQVRVERTLIQPVELNEAVSLLADAALTAEPTDTEIDFAGPERFYFDELVRATLTDAGDDREIVARDADGPVDLMVPRRQHRLGSVLYPIRGIPTAP